MKNYTEKYYKILNENKWENFGKEEDMRLAQYLIFVRDSLNQYIEENYCWHIHNRETEEYEKIEDEMEKIVVDLVKIRDRLNGLIVEKKYFIK